MTSQPVLYEDLFDIRQGPDRLDILMAFANHARVKAFHLNDWKSSRAIVYFVAFVHGRGRDEGRLVESQFYVTVSGIQCGMAFDGSYWNIEGYLVHARPAPESLNSSMEKGLQPRVLIRYLTGGRRGSLTILSDRHS